MKKIISILFGILVCFSCGELEKEETKGNILFAVSNQHTYGNSNLNTANHFAEIVLAYDVLIKEGYKIDFVSPEGGAIPIGYLNTSDSIQKKYLYDASFMKKLKHTHKPKEIDAASYKAIYYSGGGAAMYGVPENIEIQNISREIYENKGVISAVCHGTAGIVHLKGADGNYIYKGKKVNGFPDKFENKKARYYQEFPFSIQEVIQKNGGNFLYSEKGWDNYYTIDGRLITGQDPSSSILVAEKIIQTLQNNK